MAGVSMGIWNRRPTGALDSPPTVDPQGKMKRARMSNYSPSGNNPSVRENEQSERVQEVEEGARVSKATGKTSPRATGTTMLSGGCTVGSVIESDESTAAKEKVPICPKGPQTLGWAGAKNGNR